MPAIRSEIDPAAPEFATRADGMRVLAADLRARVAAAAAGGPQEARTRHMGRGKLLPRERVERLLDPGSPFLEVGALAANGM